MEFSVGDIVRLVGMGPALWRIESLGEQSFDGTGAPLSEEISTVSLFLPEAGIPLNVYRSVTWSLRQFMLYVPPMVVLALEAAREERSSATELLLEQRYARRIKKLRTLDAEAVRTGCTLKLSAFRRRNPDLLYKQAHPQAMWSNLP
jgi:hypothetical protein